MKTALALLVTSLLFGLTGCDTAHGAMRVELNPAAGEKAQYEMTLTQEISQSMMGETIDTKNTFSYGWTQTVGDSEDGVVEIGVVYDWVQVEIQLPPPAELIAFDSREPADASDPQTASFAAIVGKGFSMSASSTGEILSIEGVDEMLDAMIAELKPEQGMESMMLESLEKQFGDGSLKELMQTFMSIYPSAGEVGVGDTWTRKHVVNTMYPHVQDNTYKLLEKKDGALKVALDSKIRSQENATIDMGMMKVQVAMQGTQVGTLSLDADGGLPHESRMESNLEGSMTIVGQDLEPLPITIHQIATYSRAK